MWKSDKRILFPFSVLNIRLHFVRLKVFGNVITIGNLIVYAVFQSKNFQQVSTYSFRDSDSYIFLQSGGLVNLQGGCISAGTVGFDSTIISVVSPSQLYLFISSFRGSCSSNFVYS